MSLKLITMVTLLAGCEMSETCDTTHQEGPGLSGLATYSLGDGSQLTADLDMRGFAELTAGTITISSRFTDAFGHDRSFELRVTGMAVGDFDLAGRAEVCMPRMTNGPDVCSPVTGTISVRALDEDCYWHESGVGTCAETMDFTIHAVSAWQTTQLVLDADEMTVGSWVTEEC